MIYLNKKYPVVRPVTSLLCSTCSGFSALPDRAPILDEEMCQNLEDLVR